MSACVVFAARIVVVALLLAIGVIDLRRRVIPVALVLVASAVALVSAAWWSGSTVGHALLGGILGVAALGLAAALGRLLAGTTALGRGDVYLGLPIGLIAGDAHIGAILALGAVLGGFGALAALLTRRATLRDAMAYGPFLVAATLFALASGMTIAPLR